MNTSELFKKIQRIQSQLTQGLVEREQTIKLTLLAALAGEHILLIGPPGTGKSLVSRRLHLVFKETPYFERLLTKFSVPEELFGPLSIQALEQDKYTRLTKGYLPQSSIAFLDEIFKANSAILNALLTLLNEREFDNGVIREKVPLISVIGASNELPEDGNLSALYDRFLFRQYVEPVSKSGFKQLLMMQSIDDELSVEQLTYDELKYIQQHAKKIELSAEALQFLMELRKWCAENQIQVSDRRWRKIVGMLQVSSFTNGQSQVTIWDCWLVQHCIWEKPEQAELVACMYEQYAGHGVISLNKVFSVVDVLENEFDRIYKNLGDTSKNLTVSLPTNFDHEVIKKAIRISDHKLIDLKAKFSNGLEGKLIRWNAKTGDLVFKNQVLCVFESNHELFEIYPSHDGTLACILKNEGDYLCNEDNVGLIISVKRDAQNRSELMETIKNKLNKIFNTNISDWNSSYRSNVHSNINELVNNLFLKYPFFEADKIVYSIVKIYQKSGNLYSNNDKAGFDHKSVLNHIEENILASNISSMNDIENDNSKIWIQEKKYEVERHIKNISTLEEQTLTFIEQLKEYEKNSIWIDLNLIITAKRALIDSQSSIETIQNRLGLIQQNYESILS